MTPTETIRLTCIGDFVLGHAAVVVEFKDFDMNKSTTTTYETISAPVAASDREALFNILRDYTETAYYGTPRMLGRNSIPKSLIRRGEDFCLMNGDKVLTWCMRAPFHHAINIERSYRLIFQVPGNMESALDVASRHSEVILRASEQALIDLLHNADVAFDALEKSTIRSGSPKPSRLSF